MRKLTRDTLDYPKMIKSIRFEDKVYGARFSFISSGEFVMICLSNELFFIL